jgi:hypothetical protein
MLSQVSNNNSSFLFLLFIQSLGDGMLLIYCKPFQVLYMNFQCYAGLHGVTALKTTITNYTDMEFSYI